MQDVRLFPAVPDVQSLVATTFGAQPEIAAAVLEMIEAAQVYEDALGKLPTEGELSDKMLSRTHQIHQLRGPVQDAMLKVDKLTLMAALRAAGVTCVEVQYSGSGDEGGIDECNIEPEGAPRTFDGIGVELQWSDVRQGSIAEISAFAYSYNEDSLNEIADDAIHASGYSGYDDNDGGGGTVRFNVEASETYPAGSIVVEHYWNVMTEEAQDAVVY